MIALATMLEHAERAFLEAARVAHLATADAAGRPHVVPVCFGLIGLSAYVQIDAKPKGDPLRLKRLDNIRQNPEVALVADRYDEDWSRLGWVMLRGRAEILAAGSELAAAQALLRRRYRQLAAMDLAGLPAIALRIARVSSWGKLD
ncbi:MAG: TIGR03668 family PPOX class F420-dependent oxidoreductase [Alphaproteobacteria bacterium]|nr:TIGR03668 family PPOX class F420-dependent oxidoreductase [Alphaproteobacteria bacterium]